MQTLTLRHSGSSSPLDTLYSVFWINWKGGSIEGCGLSSIQIHHILDIKHNIQTAEENINIHWNEE